MECSVVKAGTHSGDCSPDSVTQVGVISVMGKHDKKGGDTAARGIIVAGWGNVVEHDTLSCHHLQHSSRHQIISQPLVPDLNQFKMSFTKQLLSGKSQGSSRRKPVLVSRTRSEPWHPAGVGHKTQSRVKNAAKEPFCTVCVNDNLTDADVEIRRELEREVKLLQSRPSVSYKKHSPRNWSQELLLDDVKNNSKLQQKRLKDLKAEYEEIEQKCKSKLIDDLAGFYYQNQSIRQTAHEEEEKPKKKIIKSRSINIEILDDGSVKTSKVLRSKTDNKNAHDEQVDDDDDSLSKSITISINSKSSRQSQKYSNKKSAKDVKLSKENEQQHDAVTNDDDDDDCDTLNAIDNISVHDETDSNSQLVIQNTNIRAENEALRKKYRKYKSLKNKFAKSDAEAANLRKDIDILKHDLGKLLKENTELKLQNSVAVDSESRRLLQRQDSIHEAPVRDSQDQGVQVTMNVERGASFNSLEVDYFTEVIIDELKKEIRELKNQNKVTASKYQESLKVKEDNILSKLSKLKIASEQLKTEATKTQAESSHASDVDKLKTEIENLKQMLIQERETNSTFESYIALLKNSYTSMFGPLDTK